MGGDGFHACSGEGAGDAGNAIGVVPVNNVNKCKEMQEQYPDMVPGRTWGSLPKSDQKKWGELDCDNEIKKPETVPGCSRTLEDEQPWWKVSLNPGTEVKSVRVTGASNGFSVTVNGRRGSTTCASDVQIGEGETKEVPCVGTGHEVVVSLPGKGALSVCKFEVFGKMGEAPRVMNEDKDCWSPCNKKQGKCETDFCGSEGMCCKFGLEGDGCNGAMGKEGHDGHTCSHATTIGVDRSFPLAGGCLAASDNTWQYFCEDPETFEGEFDEDKKAAEGEDGAPAAPDEEEEEAPAEEEAPSAEE